MPESTLRRNLHVAKKGNSYQFNEDLPVPAVIINLSQHVPVKVFYVNRFHIGLGYINIGMARNQGRRKFVIQTAGKDFAVLAGQDGASRRHPLGRGGNDFKCHGSPGRGISTSGRYQSNSAALLFF